MSLIILIIVLVIFVFYVAIKPKKDFNLAVEDVSAKLSLNFEKSSFTSDAKAWGVYRNKAVVIDVISKGSGKSREKYTRIRVNHGAPLAADTVIYRQLLTSRLAKFFFKSQDIGLGDASFDNKFMVKGENEEFVKKLFGRQLRGRLVSLNPSNLYFKGEKLSMEYRNYVSDTDKLAKSVKYLVDLAEKAAKMK